MKVHQRERLSGGVIEKFRVWMPARSVPVHLNQREWCALKSPNISIFVYVCNEMLLSILADLLARKSHERKRNGRERGYCWFDLVEKDGNT